jgi:hypothetical protein
LALPFDADGPYAVKNPCQSICALYQAERLAVPGINGMSIVFFCPNNDMIRKLKSGEYRIYSRKPDAKTGKRRNLGTFSSLAGAKKHESDIQAFKHKK